MADKDKSLTREQNQGAVRRGGSFDPWGMSLLPGEFFSLDPFSMMRRMQAEMDRAFGRSSGSAQQPARMWSPAIEVSEDRGNFVVCAELPGLSANDVNVEMTDDALIIQGERRDEHTSEEGGVHRSERSYGKFYRAIPLPQNVKGDQAKADFKNGVLEIKMPIEQNAQEQRRRIPVGGSSESETKPSGGPGTQGSKPKS